LNLVVKNVISELKRFETTANNNMLLIESSKLNYKLTNKQLVK